MPTVNIPEFNSKELWFNLRALFWSGLLAFVALVWLGVITPPEPIAAFMGLVTFIAFWVAIYNIYLALKGRKA